MNDYPYCIVNANVNAGEVRLPERPNALLDEAQITLRWLLLSAVGHLHAERYHAAFADCDAALRIDSENSRIYLLRGALFARMRRFADAIANLDAVIELQPNPGVAHMLRAYCHQACGHTEAADHDMRMALMQAEASMLGFCDSLGMIRTQFDASQALLDGDRNYPRLFLPPEEIERIRQAA
ncbi:MAG: hypothetical protein HQL86_01275 [Magnetococcales bacterium]|nr:hypothetical protein [Magnetococcales bacterium]